MDNTEMDNTEIDNTELDNTEETTTYFRRTTQWSSAEFKDFLDICKERKIGERLASKFPMRYVFYDVAVDLQALGYTHTVNQILYKFVNMKKKYRSYRRELDAGRLEEHHVRPFPYFDLCKELLEPLYLMKIKESSAEHDEDTMNEFSVIDDNNCLLDGTSTERIKSGTKERENSEKVFLSGNVERIRIGIQDTQMLVNEMLANHQQEMQKQQEEWRTQLVNEEREFFNKVLISFNKKC